MSNCNWIWPEHIFLSPNRLSGRNNVTSDKVNLSLRCLLLHFSHMFLYEKTHGYLKNDYQIFDTLKTKDRKIIGNCNLLIKVKFHELEWSSPLRVKIRSVFKKPWYSFHFVQNVKSWYCDNNCNLCK